MESIERLIGSEKNILNSGSLFFITFLITISWKIYYLRSSYYECEQKQNRTYECLENYAGHVMYYYVSNWSREVNVYLLTESGKDLNFRFRVLRKFHFTK